jgi:hypothetical protein
VADLPEAAFAAAVAEIEAILGQIPGVRILTNAELAVYGA